MLSLIPHLEQNQGTYYPKGGMISITNALYQLALKKGVTFQFKNKVDKILHNNKSVKGIVVNGKDVLADIIVCNGDVYYTYKHLLNLPAQTKKIEKQERSSSALIFYWGIKKEFSSLGLHNILFSENYQNEFEHIFLKKELSTDPTIYINVTSKMEKGQAPDGKENWFVMINAPNNVGQDWSSMTAALRDKVVKKINRMLQTDIESCIDNETIMDPIIIEEKTGTYLGALYGTSSNSPLAAFLRPPNFSNKIQKYLKNIISSRS
jgi:phytoene dehydrogenase-like protein